jgi:aquaporin Z
VCGRSYWFGNTLGLVAGTATFSSSITNLGQNGYGNASPVGYSLVSAMIAKIVFTFIFVFVIHGATHERVPKGFAGLAIGLTLVFVHLVCIPIDGTSVKPARSVGPAVFVGGAALSQLWLFIVAPIIGGILAGVVWKLFK